MRGISEWLLLCVVWISRCVDIFFFVFFQAEDGIRDLVRSRGLGDVYKRQMMDGSLMDDGKTVASYDYNVETSRKVVDFAHAIGCLLYTSDAADERSSVDLGGRRIIKKKMR